MAGTKSRGTYPVAPGPKEVGPFGLLQTIVDGIKLVGKELITPAGGPEAVRAGAGTGVHAGVGGISGFAVQPRSHHS